MVTAVCDLDKNTAETRQRKHMVCTRKQKKQAGCQHVVISWKLTKVHKHNIILFYFVLTRTHHALPSRSCYREDRR